MSERGPGHNRTRSSIGSGGSSAAAMAACVASLLFTVVASAQTTTHPPSRDAVPMVRPLNTLPLSFEERRQDPDAAPTFVSQGARHALTISAGGWCAR